MNALKVKKTITQQIEVTISLPRFFKYDRSLYAAYDEKTVVKVMPYEECKYFGISSCDAMLFDNEIAKGEEISEEEFNEAYETTMAKIQSLIPQTA